MVAMAGSFVAAVGVIGLTMFAYIQMIDNQNARNARLKPRL